ncbi:MAG: hypothetical protein DLM61_02295 [Pseudonocardiales bacterium]|nr:MAG: hypothetical protein DLM61_02295 [Pseudonocardiales bacterium]
MKVKGRVAQRDLETGVLEGPEIDEVDELGRGTPRAVGYDGVVAKVRADGRPGHLLAERRAHAVGDPGPAPVVEADREGLAGGLVVHEDAAVRQGDRSPVRRRLAQVHARKHAGQPRRRVAVSGDPVEEQLLLPGVGDHEEIAPGPVVEALAATVVDVPPLRAGARPRRAGDDHRNQDGDEEEE